MTDKSICLKLSREEAIVLFEWLASIDENPQGSSIGDAEQRVLWSLEGQLESTLVEVVAANYKELLESARIRILNE